MIDRHRRDDARQRALDHIGGVEPAAEPDFEKENVGGITREQQKRGRGLDLEHRDRRVAVPGFAFGERSGELSILDKFSAAVAADAEALVEMNQIGRRIDMHALAGRFKNRAHEGDGRAFAVGAGDMDQRRQFLFGMIERGKQALDAIERQIDALWMQRQEPRQNGVDCRRAGTRAHAGAGRLASDCGTLAGALVKSRHSFGDGCPHLEAMHHHVDHAVIAQVLGFLESVGQFFADGLLDDARAGEADQRAGLGDVHVAQHRVGRGDAAGGRIGQHDDVGPARLAQPLHRDGGARQLHQRQDALLHARAARGREQHERTVLLHRGVEPLDHRLARRHAERAAHEIEILHADDGSEPVEPAEAEFYRVVEAGLAARIFQPIDIAALVAEAQRIDRHLGHGDVEPGLVVEHRLEPRRGAHAHVIVGTGDDELVGLDVLVEHQLAGFRALDPQIARRLAAQDAADLRPHDVGNPIHRVLTFAPVTVTRI